MTKKIVGIILALLGIALVAFAIHTLVVNLPTEGPLKGSIRGYKPPYKGHPFVILGGGVAGIVSFLVGGLVLGLGKMDK